jgi:hypothetical protein
MISKKGGDEWSPLFFSEIATPACRNACLPQAGTSACQARPLAFPRNDAQIVIARECLPALYHPRFRAYGRQEITEAISFDFTYERC